jgi:curli biogenesis system outer membrane secretion channel CsgG
MFVGLAAGSIPQSSLTIDVRVIDTRTSRVLATTTVEGTSTDFGGGVLGAGVPFVGALACWQRTPLEKPLRAAVAKAVSFIAEKTPANYYRHAE